MPNGWLPPPPKAQIHHHLFGLGADILGQDTHLLQLLGQGLAVIGVAGEAARAHHQALRVCDGHAGLHAELVGLSGFALANAFDLGSMQGVQLVLVLRTLGADALGALHQRCEVVELQGRRLAGLCDLALHLTQRDPQDGVLAFEHLAQALVEVPLKTKIGDRNQVCLA